MLFEGNLESILPEQLDDEFIEIFMTEVVVDSCSSTITSYSSPLNFLRFLFV